MPEVFSEERELIDHSQDPPTANHQTNKGNNSPLVGKKSSTGTATVASSTIKKAPTITLAAKENLFDWAEPLLDELAEEVTTEGTDAKKALQKSLTANLEKKYAQAQSLCKTVSTSEKDVSEREQLEESMKDVSLLVELLMQELEQGNNSSEKSNVAVQTGLEEEEEKEKQAFELEEKLLAEEIKSSHLETVNSELQLALADALAENKDLVRLEEEYGRGLRQPLI